MKRLFISLCWLLLCSQTANAKSCFLEAQSYYEQIYCEVKSNGKGRALPSFTDFKKNNEMTQALLLKRDALSLRIDFKMPARKNTVTTTKPSTTIASTLKTRQKTASEHGSCALAQQQIRCGATRFELQANRKNKHLPARALSASNRLELSTFNDNKNDAQAFGAYLTRSYVKYLESMQSIGLAGVTMPYSRFYFLFSDLKAKGVDARARFAQMFEYLKQDKSRNAVSEYIEAPAELSINDCAKVNQTLFVCDHHRRNYLFLRSGA